MFRSILLIIYILSLAQARIDVLKYLQGVPKMSNDPECNLFYLDVVNYYFTRTYVKDNNSPDYEYCEIDETGKRKSRSTSQNWQRFETDLTQIINFYSSLPYVSTYSNENDNSPVDTYGAIRVNTTHEIPIYTTANIRYQHTLGDRSRNYPPELEDQMDLMGRRDTDDRGHLLAISLGGGNAPLNFIPMARRLNRHLPYSPWRAIEVWISNFLNNYRNGRVIWRVALQYAGNIIIFPTANNFRPQGLTVQYTAYTDSEDDSSVSFQSPQISFYNDNELACHYTQTGPRNRRSVGNKNDKCYAGAYPQQPQGKLGQETSSGDSNEKYQIVFPFAVGGKHYFHGQKVDGEIEWFIQELNPGGHLGKEVYAKCWVHKQFHLFPIFPYSINGRHFFYGQCSNCNTYDWYIYELRSNGAVDRAVISTGQWDRKFHISFPYNIDGKYYFYRLSIEKSSDVTKCIIQELLPDGQMGEQTDQGEWSHSYFVSFAYSISGNSFLLNHSNITREWFINQLLSGGKMGGGISSGTWDLAYDTAFPFTVGGKHFFYAQDYTEGNWMIQELLPGGLLGKVTDSGCWFFTKYTVMFPFLINNHQYLYGYDPTSNKWFIRELV